MRADLHTHTVVSDGELFPRDVADSAAKNGVELIAVSDHDAMQACAELSVLAKERGLNFVNAIEVSAYDERIKFHTLGYNLDEEKFKPFLDRLFENSFKRAEDIIFKLNAIGIKLTMEDVDAERYSKTAPVHSMHIARAMVKRGYGDNVIKVFRKYFTYGKPAFSVIHRPTPEETCEAITYAGGLAVVAHPGRINMSGDVLEKKLVRLKDCGLGGIEVYYTTHTQIQTAYYENLAESLCLLKTGGSDTHRFGSGREIGKPVFHADKELLERLGL